MAATAKYAEDFARSTGTNSAVWVNAASIAAVDLEANKKYLILAMGNLVHGNTTTSSQIRLVRGSTVLCDSVELSYEPRGTTSRPMWTLMEVNTQPASAEAITIQIKPSSTTAGTVDSQVWVLKLSDDFTENTDYFYNEVTVNNTIASTWEDGASVTFTPDGTSTYLILGNTLVDPAATSGSTEVAIYDGTTRAPIVRQEAKDATTDKFGVFNAMRVVPAAASTTYKVQFQEAALSSPVALRSAIFVLRLDKFSQFSVNYTEAEIDPAASPTWTNLAGIDPNPTVTGNWFILGYAVYDGQSLGEGAAVRLQINPSGGGLVSNPAYGDDAPQDGNMNDATDEAQTHLMKQLSLTSGAAREINYDGTDTSGSGTTERFEDRLLVGFSLELAGGVADLTVDKSESITVTDTPLRTLESNRSVSDSITITEAVDVDIVTGGVFPDTVTITESVVVVIVSPVQDLSISATDSIAISESGGQVYRNFVLGDNPVSYWRLGESAGPTAIDQQGNNSGTYNGTPGFSQASNLTGDPDTAVLFNSGHTGDYVDGGSNSSLDITGSLSIEAWVKPASLVLSAVVDHAQEGLTIENYAILMDASGTIYFQYRAAGAWQSVTSASYWTAGDWHHVVVTFDSGTVTIYKNGSQVKQQGSMPALETDTANVFKIARYQVGSQGWLAGTIDEVAVYNSVLSLTEVADHYAGRLGAVKVEVVSALQDLSIAVSDSITITENRTVQLDNYTVNKSDSITITESIGRLLESERSVSDSITITELVSVALSNALSVSDNITITEDIQRLLESYVNKSESITVTENTAALLPELLKAVFDSVTVTEALQRELSSFINKSESISVTESTRLDLPLAVNVSDSITVSESRKVELESRVSVSDSITITDTPLMGGVPNPNVSDSITVSEAILVSAEQGIAEMESVSVTESVSLELSAVIISVSDSVSVSESRQIEITSFVPTNDPVTITESVSVQLGVSINKSESITITESQSAVVANGITVSDSIALTELVSVFVPFLTIISSESISLSEAVQVNFELNINKSESVSVSESTKLTLESSISKSESVSVSESVSLSIVSAINVSDTVTVSESVKLEITSFIGVSDSTTITDVVQMGGVPNPSVSDNITISEVVSVAIPGGGASVFDSIAVSESVSLTLSDVLISVSDSISVTESVNREELSFISKSENITVSEQTSLVYVSDINIGDTVSISENTQVQTQTGISVSETATITENVQLIIPTQYINKSESITLSESVTVNLASNDISIVVREVIGRSGPKIIILTNGRVAYKLTDRVYLPL